MRKFEVIMKEIETAKLTVAKDRITLKLPILMNAQEKSEIEALTHKIDSEVPEVHFTLRGRFWNRTIRLSDKSYSIQPMSWSY